MSWLRSTILLADDNFPMDNVVDGHDQHTHQRLVPEEDLDEVHVKHLYNTNKWPVAVRSTNIAFRRTSSHSLSSSSRSCACTAFMRQRIRVWR